MNFGDEWLIFHKSSTCNTAKLPAGANPDTGRLFRMQRPRIQRPCHGFLERYNDRYTQLYTASNEAQWKANTQIIPGDSTNDKASQQAQETYAAFTGPEEYSGQRAEFPEGPKPFRYTAPAAAGHPVLCGEQSGTGKRPGAATD